MTLYSKRGSTGRLVLNICHVNLLFPTLDVLFTDWLLFLCEGGRGLSVFLLKLTLGLNRAGRFIGLWVALGFRITC